jgi:hypothetical protein
MSASPPRPAMGLRRLPWQNGLPPMNDRAGAWRKCSICKEPIEYGSDQFVCSVSTCRRGKNPLFFCSLGCWEAHLPMMRHRDAWAEQERAPSREQAEREASAEAERSRAVATAPPASAGARAAPATPTEVPVSGRRVIGEPVRRVVGSSSSSAEATLRTHAPTEVELHETDEAALPEDVLVVVSKLKAYIRARSGMNTSDGVVGVLSDHLRRLCVEAIRNAARDDRRTVMDRDFRPLL